MQLKRPQLGGIDLKGGLKAKGSSAKASAKPSKVGDEFVLFLGDDGAILVFMQGGQVVRRLFAASAEKEHLSSLVELMRAHPAAPISVLVDMIDQSYVRHTLPPVSSLGINKLVQRRLDRDFAPEDIKGALPLGRETTGRKEWSFLLISLANSSTFQQWVNVIHELPNRFLGVYLVPVEAQDFIAAISESLPAEKDPAQWQILVTHNKVSGYRQVVLKNGALIFTRLTQGLNESTADVAAGNVEQEIQNTIEYLRRLSFNDAAGLDIFVIVSQEIKDRLDIRRFNARRMMVQTPFEISQSLGFKQAALSGDRFGDVVISSGFASIKKHRLKLLTVYGKKLEKLYQARLGARGLCAALLVYFVYSILAGLLAMQSADSEAESLVAQEKQAKESLEKLKAKINAVDGQQRTFSKVAVVYQALNVGRSGPLDFVKTLAPIMPEGTLMRSIDWKQDDDVLPTAGGAPVAAPIVAPYSIVLDLEINDYKGKRDTLIELSKALLDRVVETFPESDVTPVTMPGMSKTNETVQLNFNETKDVTNEVKEGENLMSLTIAGPKKVEPVQGGI